MRNKLPEALLFAVLCAPVAASAQTPSPTEGVSAPTSGPTGTVVFFREKKFAGGGMNYKVRENGVEICKLQNGTYCVITVRAGVHVYEVHSEAKDTLTLEVESGENYFVKSGFSVGIIAGRPNLSPSDSKTFVDLKEKLKNNTGIGLKRTD